MSKARAKGTRTETWVVTHMRLTHWPLAERRSLKGGKDQGDLNVHPDLVIEVKAARSYCIPSWMDETELERRNALAYFGVLVVKPVGYAKERVGKFWTFMRADAYVELAERAIDNGWGPWVPKPVVTWKKLDIEDWLKEAPVVRYFARGRKEAYTVMRLDDALELLAHAGLGQPGRVDGSFVHHARDTAAAV